MPNTPTAASGRLLPVDDDRLAARITDSGSSPGDPAEADDITAWLADRQAAHPFEVEPIPFAAMADWFFEPTTGNLAHRTGRFFTVEGVEVQTDHGPVSEWSQPIINQPEIGVLGILVKEIDGVLHCLMQAKMEPGNINLLQLSPTVQATRSNYTRVHGGGGTRYLEYFAEPGRSRVLVDVLQSEQGAWFLGKRNRNMVVEVTEDVPPHEDYRWMTIGRLQQMLRQDNLVNMDARTVLSCLPFTRPATPAGGDSDAFTAALRRSMAAGSGALHSMNDVMSWFTGAKWRYVRRTHRIPLRHVQRWERDEREIRHADGKHFTVMATAVRAGSREVASWSQPLLAPRGQALVALLTKVVDGVLHVLLHARVEAGHLDVAELAPTLQCTPENYAGMPVSTHPPFLEYVRAVPADRIRYQARLSEEGGRFYQAEGRYLIIEVADDFPITVPSDYRWMTVAQLTRLLRHSHYLNVQARTLVACLHSLW